MIWEIEDGPRTVEGLDERGRPRPEYAAALGLVPAPLGRRVLATVYEVLFVLVLLVPAAVGALPAILEIAGSANPVDALFARGDALWIVVWSAVSYGLSTVFILVQLILMGRRGVTLGKALTGLRSVNVATLERPKFWRGAVVRYLILWASFFVPLVGPLLVIMLSPLFDPQRRRRGWADLAAATWLVDITRGLNPYDAKRMRIARKTVATDLRDEKTSLPSLATSLHGAESGVYIPVARNRGGVLGAPRERSGVPDPEKQDAGPMAPIQASPFAVAAKEPAPAEAAPAPAAASSPASAPAPAAAPAPVRDAAPAPAAVASGAAQAPAVEPAPVPARTASPAGPASETLAAPGETLLPRAETASWTPPHLIENREPTASLVLDSGDRVEVVVAGIVVGRSPVAGPDDSGAVVVPVADPSMSMSKTHFALRWRGGSLVVVDLGSTNGSAIVRDGAETDLPAGAALPLRSGDTLRFGDRYAAVSIA
ncbi:MULTISPECIES: RDD family protein [unclassified Microbacterium]|uniref:RDD family protein n=1 Tax=unclassified Microbacterium TaxID=2609290 RepID=UPI003863DF4B